MSFSILWCPNLNEIKSSRSEKLAWQMLHSWRSRVKEWTWHYITPTAGVTRSWYYPFLCSSREWREKRVRIATFTSSPCHIHIISVPHSHHLYCKLGPHTAVAPNSNKKQPSRYKSVVFHPVSSLNEAAEVRSTCSLYSNQKWFVLDWKCF